MRTKLGIFLSTLVITLGGMVTAAAPASAQPQQPVFDLSTATYVAGARAISDCTQGKICAFRNNNWTGGMYYWTASFYWGQCVAVGAPFGGSSYSWVNKSPGTSSVIGHGTSNCTGPNVFWAFAYPVGDTPSVGDTWPANTLKTYSPYWFPPYTSVYGIQFIH